MNTINTSREAIIEASKKLASKNGLSKLNMRDVAIACDISVGSVYNYFPSKPDLIAAIVENIWKNIFQINDGENQFKYFDEAVEDLFKKARLGSNKYPDFFTKHTMNFSSTNKSRGREVMNQYIDNIKQNLMHTLQIDPKVADHIFDSDFSREHFIDFIFANIILALTWQNSSCSTLLQVIRKTIYR